MKPDIVKVSNFAIDICESNKKIWRVQYFCVEIKMAYSYN